MNHPMAMRGVQGVGDLDGDAQGFVERQRLSCQPRCQRLAFQVLHYQEIDFCLFAYVIENADMSVLQRRDGFGFALEPRAQIRVRGEMRRQDFDGYRAIEPCVSGAIDLAHTAGADRRENLVWSEARTSGERHTALNDSISHSVNKRRLRSFQDRRA